MMRWHFSLLVSLMGGILAAVCPGSSARADDELAIVSGGRTEAAIVVSPQAGPNEKLAAEDLQKYIGLMTGVRPDIAGPETLQGEGPFLIVGRAAIEADAKLEAALDKVVKKDPVLRGDAIALKREGNRVYLAGNNDESHYYAVAELLHRWGCRWYLPTDFGECIPERKTLSIGTLDHAYAPPFEIRSYWISWNGDSSGYREFKRRNKMTHGVHVPNGHAIGKYVKALGKDAFHIPISDMSTAQHVAKQVEDKFAKGEYIIMGMEDGMYTPVSEKDKKLMRLQFDKYFMRSAVTDSFMEFYNNLSRILLEEHPGSKSKIGFLAYSNMTLPPVRKMTAEKPLVAYLAPIDIDPIHGMDDPDSPPRQEYKEMMYQWARVMQGRLAIYDYDQGMMVWRDIPNPAHQSFRQDVKHYRKAGILGVDTECRNAIGTVFTNLHIRGRLMWDPDADVHELLAEFYPKFYGPAAEPMANYWGAIYEAWEKTIITEHEYFIAPAIYTPELIAELEKHLLKAEKLIAPVREKAADRNDRLYVQRMDFTRLSFEIIRHYMGMVQKAASDCNYAEAHAIGQKGLAVRLKLAGMNPTFTTRVVFRGERWEKPENPAWFRGEVHMYKELAALTDGTKGTLVQKLPLEWAFRRDKKNVGLKEKYHITPVDLSYWKANAANLTPANRKDYPDQWEMLSTDLYMQAQGIRDPDRQSFTGHAWYRTDVELDAKQTEGAVRICFPGIFNEAWLYVNGKQAGHRKQNVLYWMNDYKFQWDVDLTAKLRPGQNVLAVRVHNPHHLGGMFRRPFLYRAKR